MLYCCCDCFQALIVLVTSTRSSAMKMRELVFACHNCGQVMRQVTTVEAFKGLQDQSAVTGKGDQSAMTAKGDQSAKKEEAALTLAVPSAPSPPESIPTTSIAAVPCKEDEGVKYCIVLKIQLVAPCSIKAKRDVDDTKLEESSKHQKIS